MVTTSIVASMYNKSQETLDVIDRLFLPSIIRSGTSETQLVLVDDQSPWASQTDRIVERHLPDLKRTLGNVSYSRNPQNLGFARSYNRGVSLAEGANLVITNDDVYFPEAALEDLVQPLQDSAIGLVGPVTNYASGFQKIDLFKKLKDYSPEEFRRIDAFAQWLRNTMGKQLFDVRYFELIGFCFSMRHETWDAVAGFDPRFLYGGYEDTDLNRRIEKRGYRLVLHSGTFIEHGGPNGGSMSLRQDGKIFRTIENRNGKIYAEKWGDLLGTFPHRLRMELYDRDVLTVSNHIRRTARRKGAWQDYLSLAKTS